MTTVVRPLQSVRRDDWMLRSVSVSYTATPKDRVSQKKGGKRKRSERKMLSKATPTPRHAPMAKDVSQQENR